MARDGRSENAVRIPLYVVIIAFLLLRLMKQHPLIAGDPSLETASLRDLRIKLKLPPSMPSHHPNDDYRLTPSTHRST